MYMRRLSDPVGPWTRDPILLKYRFTNVYRALDRVSQYLLREVIYNNESDLDFRDILYRIILFKTFNKIETWEAIERRFGVITAKNPTLDDLDSFLSVMMSRGAKIYSAAYIMPSPNFGGDRKHTNHLRLIHAMLAEGAFDRIKYANSLESIYNVMLSQPGIGKFLAFQYAIDVNYSEVVGFEESDFVIAGPGALDGISKCFSSTGGYSPEEVIHKVCDEQEYHFARLNLEFSGLFGRRMQPIDCQNVFCEISKYARVAHPEASGVLGRTRIKQIYSSRMTIQRLPLLPPKWGVRLPSNVPQSTRQPTGQMDFFE